MEPATLCTSLDRLSLSEEEAEEVLYLVDSTCSRYKLRCATCVRPNMLIVDFLMFMLTSAILPKELGNLFFAFCFLLSNYKKSTNERHPLAVHVVLPTAVPLVVPVGVNSS